MNDDGESFSSCTIAQFQKIHKDDLIGFIKVRLFKNIYEQNTLLPKNKGSVSQVAKGNDNTLVE